MPYSDGSIWEIWHVLVMQDMYVYFLRLLVGDNFLSLSLIYHLCLFRLLVKVTHRQSHGCGLAGNFFLTINSLLCNLDFDSA
jgi:hypothetical protein